MNIRKFHFIKAGEVIKAGLVTDQIFPWLKTKDLDHEVLRNLKKLVDTSYGGKFDPLALKRSSGNDS